jgi:hypothetical protein
MSTVPSLISLKEHLLVSLDFSLISYISDSSEGRADGDSTELALQMIWVSKLMSNLRRLQ